MFARRSIVPQGSKAGQPQPKRVERRKAIHVAIESLEPRLVFSVITVNTLSDNVTSNATLSLREAVELVNAGGNAQTALGRSLTSGEAAQIDTTQPYGTNDTIVFSSSLANGTIDLGSELPITSQMTIDGGTTGMTLDGGSSATWRAMNVSSTGTLTLNHLTISDFHVVANGGGQIAASGQGGAIYVNSGTLTVMNSTLTHNSAIGGSTSGTGVIAGSGNGGAIYAAGGTINVTATTFFSNSVTGGNESGTGGIGGAGNGGAINISSGTLNITGSLFNANTGNGGSASGTGTVGGPSDGGAIYDNATALTTNLSIIDSTFTANAVNGGPGSVNNQGIGGAIYDVGTLNMDFATLSGNSAANGRNVYLGALDTGVGMQNSTPYAAVINNSIIGQADGSTADLVVATGGFFNNNSVAVNLSGSNDLIRNTTATGLTYSNADPMLSTLANNGGATKTMAIQSGGPAVDAGMADAVTTDQRGANRVYGSAPDIGAYENHGSTTFISPLTFTTANSATLVAGTPASFSFFVDGASTTTTITEAGSLPPGLTLTDNHNGTATLSGTPTSTGSFALTMTAANADEPSATQAFTVIVSQAPAFTSANEITFVQGTATTFTVTTTGYPNATLSATGALPSGVTFTDNGDGTGTISGTAPTSSAASYPITLVANNGVSGAVTQNFMLDTVSPPAATLLVSSSAPGSGIEVKNADGTTRLTIADPFNGQKVTRNFAQGDVNGDGTPDIIVGAGPGGSPDVVIYDGSTGAEIRRIAAFASNYTGGVSVAEANVGGNSYLIVGKGYDKHSDASIRIFSADNGSQLANFKAFNAHSPVYVTTADINGDGVPDIIATQGKGGKTSKIRVFDGMLLETGVVKVLSTITPFGKHYRHGVYVTTGDVNNDGKAEIIVGQAAGSDPSVKVFNGSTGAVISSFSTPSSTGAQVTSYDYNGDGHADIIVNVHTSVGRQIKTFSGVDDSLLNVMDVADDVSIG